jgi:hypothetical protein
MEPRWVRDGNSWYLVDPNNQAAMPIAQVYLLYAQQPEQIFFDRYNVFGRGEGVYLTRDEILGILEGFNLA